MADSVPASEFTRNFGRYRMRAQREAVGREEGRKDRPSVIVLGGRAYRE
jgi:hypothetical protein